MTPEKVIGTLQHEGYRQVENEEDAGLILYNTCSIRDKAEGKRYLTASTITRSFIRLVSASACWDAWHSRRGRRFLTRAGTVCVACLGIGLLSQAARDAGQAGSRGKPNHRAGRPPDQNETFETEFTARQNQFRGYITIIEGCDKFCSYCVVPYTRGQGAESRI